MGNSGSTIVSPQNPVENQVPSAVSCPVDENARRAWLEAARNNPSLAKQHPASLIPSDSRSNNEQDQRSTPISSPPNISRNDGSSVVPGSSQEAVARPHEVSQHNRAMQIDGAREQRTSTRSDPNKISNSLLGTQRVTSSIPRADMAPATTTPDPRSMPSSEGAEPKSGNWIYPSEKMFFDAMKRKSFSPDQKDMPAIVPIHNAVNERAWSMIMTWESSSDRLKTLNATCGGPKLRSFSGDAAKLSPKARVLGWVGYQAPFDRHDWVVERCEGGGSVEYVIDFYKGRGDGLAFYLDVRPKLNTWEGCRMRMGSWVGLT
ncbi:MAG: hypothetical protein Q9169_000423 [Polycauliona sp. 2 TL-2023]